MAKFTIILAAAVMMLAGCDRNTADDPQPVATTANTANTNGSEQPAAPATKPIENPPGLTNGDDVQRYDDLVVGKPRQHWIDTYGPSDSASTFFVKDGVHEYQVELRNVFRDDDPEFDKVEIHEDTWDEDGFTFVLWSFRKAAEQPWEAVQAMSYSDDVEF